MTRVALQHSEVSAENQGGTITSINIDVFQSLSTQMRGAYVEWMHERQRICYAVFPVQDTVQRIAAGESDYRFCWAKNDAYFIYFPLPDKRNPRLACLHFQEWTPLDISTRDYEYTWMLFMTSAKLATHPDAIDWEPLSPPEELTKAPPIDFKLPRIARTLPNGAPGETCAFPDLMAKALWVQLTRDGESIPEDGRESVKLIYRELQRIGLCGKTSKLDSL